MALAMVDGVRADVAALQARFGDQVRSVSEKFGETYVCVERSAIREVMEFLRDDEALQYDYFVECLGADYSAWEHPRDLTERFEVIYNLYATRHLARLFLKVGVNDGDTVPSVKSVFLGAEYPEREVNDLFGIVFAGNEQVQRFLLPDDWKGFPLRKDFPLGGEDVLFDGGDRGPAVEDLMVPHAGESFGGKTGSQDVSGR
ncbi:MAG: NADH-quinone oxidoreductase subunit C [Fimbriimonadaceae bacterium]|nr:NADH-quinone oxidoreductase subunit C [Fimbriimonadaceae bacterium]